jgi:hypothetical protein
MARTTLIIGLVPMGLDIDHGPFLNLKVTVLEKNFFFLPGGNLDVAGNIDCTGPAVIAYIAQDNLVHLDFLMSDQDCLGFGHPLCIL